VTYLPGCFFVLLTLFTLSAARAEIPVVFDLGLLPGDTAVGLATHTQQEPSVAQGGEHYLAVWSDYRGQATSGSANQSYGDIFGIRLDGDGDPIEPVPFMIAGGMGLQQRPQVAWNGSAWLVVYVSQDRAGGYFEDRIRAVRVSSQGEVLDPVPIVFPPTQFTPDYLGLQVAGQAGQWLVSRCIYHDDGYGTKLVGQRIDSGGHLLDSTPRLLLDWVYGQTKLLAAGGEYLAAGPDWNNSVNFKACRVGLDASPIGAPFTVPDLNLATNGDEYYVAWVKDYDDIVGSRMTRTGTLLTPQGTPLVTDFTQYTQSTLAHDGRQWWFEWGVSDLLRTVRIDALGNVLDAGGGVLLPIHIGGNINTAYSPLMVAARDGGVHLYWYDLRVDFGYDANVFSLPISSENVPGSERSISTGTRNHRVPDFAGGPVGQVAVTFVSELAGDDRVLVHLLDASGRPLAPEPVEVARDSQIGKSGIAWNGDVYLVVWDSGSAGILARRLQPDGAFVDASPLSVMPGFSPDVEALGEDFLIACSRFDTYPQYIYAWMRIMDGPSGAFQDSPARIGGGYVSVGPRVRQDGSRWLVTYHSHWTHDSSQSDALYNFVDHDGTFTPALNPCSSSGSAGTPDVAFSGSKYLFVWRNNSLSNANNYIAGRIMNPDGTFGGNQFTIAEAPGRQLRPVAGWDGSRFVVAWDDQRNQEAFFDERTDIYGTLVSESGVVLEPSGFPLHRGPQGDAEAALLSRTDGSSLVACARFGTAAPHDTYRIGLTAIGMDMSTGVQDGGAPPYATMRTTFTPVLQASPNPFHSETTLELGLDLDLVATGEARLSVHDLQGRVIRTWNASGIAAGGQGDAATGGGSAGAGRITWDGRLQSGAEAPDGVYFVRLESGGRALERGLRLVKISLRGE